MKSVTLSRLAWRNMFEAFSTTKAEGLGTGFAICRSIVEAHRGRLWASANAPFGAVFQFALPPHQNQICHE
ncbi:ATP-binding protein [Cupriavidus necator]|uniref:ATP-binding protein n=1 Tax=Cupriavidus necator TaxID=106590 RepID=UPI0009C25BD5|nr:ATP-binding protein [Cupriavidus necator]